MSSPVLRAAVAAVLAVCCGHDAWAQAQGLRLQRSMGAPPSGDELPAFVISDRLEGSAENELRAIGNAELRKGNTTLFADRIDYLVPFEEAEATGSVHLRLGDDEMKGPRLRLRLNDTTGIFEQPTFNLAPRQIQNYSRPTPARGDAQALRFDGEEHYRISDGRFTTCKPGQDDWYVTARELDLDMQREIGTARGASVSFFGVSTPALPEFDFSLNNQRKTGFLPPTAGVTGKGGPEFSIPFYWNIAPERDATITPRYMERRGLQIMGEGRYIDPSYRGEARGEILPHDDVTGTTRWAYTWLNSTSQPGSPWSSYINVQRVSDDNYFRDLASRLSVATQLYLPADAYVNYSSGVGGIWNVMARTQSWQTLQDPNNPVTQPYNRLPQITGNYLKQRIGPFDVNVAGEFVSFDTAQDGFVTGNRGYAYPSISMPILRPQGFFTPKIGYQYANYNLDTAQNPLIPSSQSRGLPLASLDTGLFFEKDTKAFGRDFLQTLEPRAYYLYVPYRDQSNIPLFDTAVADFNYSQIFAENYYSGIDRISDANQLTLAMTSRLILPSTGQEILRGIIGQRYYVDKTQQVTLNSTTPPREGYGSPLILGLAGRISENWTADATVQYAMGGNQAEDGFQRANIGARFSPELSKVINMAYRYTAPGLGGTSNEIRQVDVSAQWPMGGGFYLVGRFNYDLVGGQPTEILGGVEYNAGCWIIRAVVHSFSTAVDTKTNLFFLQLELNGFSRFGSNPLEALRRNIPGYAPLGRAPATARPYSLDPVGPLGGPTGGGYTGTSSVPYDY